MKAGFENVTDNALRVWYQCFLNPIVPFRSRPELRLTDKAESALQELVSLGLAEEIDPDGSILGERRYEPTEMSLMPEIKRRGLSLHLGLPRDKVQIFKQEKTSVHGDRKQVQQRSSSG